MTTRRTFLATLAATGIAAALPRSALAGAAAPVADAPDAFTRPGWGVCIAPQIGAEAMSTVLALLNPATWQAYGTWQNVAHPGRLPAIYSEALFDRAAVRAWLAAHPGDTWLLVNEPDEPSQANMTPTQGVALTLEFIDLARQVGNKFQWCSPQVTLKPAGLAWLTEYMQIMRQYKGIHRPAYWAIHPYPSSSLAAFRAAWAAWRSWYATWGSGAPVVLSEVCAENAPYAAQVAVMDEAKAMLNRGEVAGVYWYIASHAPINDWPNAALVDDAGRLTALGQHWMALR